MILMLFFIFCSSMNIIFGKRLTLTNEENCDIPAGWMRIRENSKYLVLDMFRKEKLNAATMQTRCETQKLHLAGIGHLADWLSIQTLLRKELKTAQAVQPSVVILSDQYDSEKRRWENIYSKKRPFAIWNDVEPSTWKENTMDIWLTTRKNATVIGANDIEKIIEHNYLVLCQFPYSTPCFQKSIEEEIAARNKLNDDEPIWLGESDKFVWYLGPDQRNYFEAKDYCEEKGYILFDKNTQLNSSDYKAITEMLNFYFKEMEGLDSGKDVLLGRMDFSTFDTGKPEKGATRDSFNPDCVENTPTRCFTRNTGPYRSFAFNFYLCLETISGPFNTEGL